MQGLYLRNEIWMWFLDIVIIEVTIEEIEAMEKCTRVPRQYRANTEHKD